jgi:hypothetical protein
MPVTFLCSRASRSILRTQPRRLHINSNSKQTQAMTSSTKSLPASSSQTQRLASRNSLPSKSRESRESIIVRAIAGLEEDDEDFDDIKIDQARVTTFSKTPLPSASALDVSELLNSRNSLAPLTSRDKLLSVLERSIADLEELDFEDCDDVNIDTIDWGRSSHHRNYDSRPEQ